MIRSQTLALPPDHVNECTLWVSIERRTEIENVPANPSGDDDVDDSSVLSQRIEAVRLTQTREAHTRTHAEHKGDQIT